MELYLNFLIYLYKKCKYNKAEQEAELINLVKKHKKIVLWGASLFLEELLSKKSLDTKNILGIIDKNPSKTGEKMHGIEIFSPEAIKDINPEVIILTIVNNSEQLFSLIKKEINSKYAGIKLLKLKPKKEISISARTFLGLKIIDTFKHIQTLKQKKTLLNNLKHAPRYLMTDSSHNYFNILINSPEFKYTLQHEEDNLYFCWGMFPNEFNIETIIQAYYRKKPVIFLEDGFLRSADTFANSACPVKYKKGISFTVDYFSPYFDATNPSYLENMLNDDNLELTPQQFERARLCIDKIVKNHLTKYNHQPIFTPDIGRVGAKKVLVVDQSYGDFSVKKGMANDKTFKVMLESAIKQNPDADIIVKTHPDTMASTRAGYYTNLKPKNNVYLLTEPINPISLIQYVDKVYVCTTQFGFEALMCKKEVHTFGMPFYAGWGLTKDYKHLHRRKKQRALEELFYITYIMYSKYVNPLTQKECEIEEAMDYLINLREEYMLTKKGDN